MLRETLAFVYYVHGEIDRAEERYREVIALSPFHVNALYNMGRIARRRNRYHEAVEYFHRAVRAQPADADLLFAYAEAAMDVDPLRAAAGFERYLDTSPTDRERLRAAGDALRDARFFVSARRAYRMLLERYPDDSGGLFGMAVVLLVGIEESAHGLDYLRRALDGGFADPEALQKLVESVAERDRAAVRAIVDAHTPAAGASLR